MKKILLALLLINVSARGQNLNSQLRTCYPFDGNTQNYAVSGSVLNGSSSNVGFSTGHTGANSTALHLNGSVASYVSLPSHNFIKAQQVSVSAWYYADTIQDSYLIFTANNCGFNDEAYALVYKVNSFMTEMASGVNGCSRTQVFSSAITANTWYHVVFCIDTTGVQLYVNGVLTSQSHNLSWDYSQGANVIIGNSLNPALQAPFLGKVDDLRIYDRILTQAEVNLLYTTSPSCISNATGIASEGFNSEAEWTIYPVPASGLLTIQSNSGHEVSGVKIMTLSGALVNDMPCSANQINVSQLSSGLFLLEIKDEQGNCTKRKLVIE